MIFEFRNTLQLWIYWAFFSCRNLAKHRLRCHIILNVPGDNKLNLETSSGTSQACCGRKLTSCAFTFISKPKNFQSLHRTIKFDFPFWGSNEGRRTYRCYPDNIAWMWHVELWYNMMRKLRSISFLRVPQMPSPLGQMKHLPRGIIEVERKWTNFNIINQNTLLSLSIKSSYC